MHTKAAAAQNDKGSIFVVTSLVKVFYFKTMHLLLLLPLLFYHFNLFTHLSGRHGATLKMNWAGEEDLKFSLSLSHMVEKRFTVILGESMKRRWWVTAGPVRH